MWTDSAQIINLPKLISHLLIVIILNNRADHQYLEVVFLDYLVKFEEYMFDTFDSSKGSREEDVSPSISLYDLDFFANLRARTEGRALDDSIDILVDVQLLEHFLCDSGHISTDGDNALAAT
jgi:hypothetical protein